LRAKSGDPGKMIEKMKPGLNQMIVHLGPDNRELQAILPSILRCGTSLQKQKQSTSLK